MIKGGLITAGLLSLSLFLAAACGGDDEPKATSTPRPTATATPAATPTDTPAATSTPTQAAATSPPPTATATVEAPSEGGDPVAGKELYLNVPDNAAPQALWCSHCHMIEGVAAGLIGPDHTNLATDAADRKPGMSAEEYIRESIKDPVLFVAEGVARSTPGLMTNAITEKLTDKQIEDLVAYLLTLK